VRRAGTLRRSNVASNGAAERHNPSAQSHRGGPVKIVAVTACPTGVAHIYMAAEQLEKTAKKLGHTIKVETQGSMGIENELSQAEIDAADVAIIAADIALEYPDRFVRVRKVEVSVQSVIRHPEAVFNSL
jgi:fructose-specific phosphotransferase system IIB component